MLAILPRVLSRQYRGTIRFLRFAQYPPLQASEETTEQVKRLSPVNMPFRVLVFLFVVIGGTVVASRLAAHKNSKKKGIACCSAEVCARKHHHE